MYLYTSIAKLAMVNCLNTCHGYCGSFLSLTPSSHILFSDELNFFLFQAIIYSVWLPSQILRSLLLEWGWTWLLSCQWSLSLLVHRVDRFGDTNTAVHSFSEESTHIKLEGKVAFMVLLLRDLDALQIAALCNT